MIKRETSSVSDNGIAKILDSLGYESGYDYSKLPEFFDLANIDTRLTKIIEWLLKKILQDDNKETGYMSKIRDQDIILSEIISGTNDGEHIRFDVDDFLTLYRLRNGEKKREKLLYDIHTHEVADIGPSPNDLTNLFKDVTIFGCHFSIVVTATKIYLLVRTRQTPSLEVMDAIKHTNSLAEKFKQLFIKAISEDRNFIATQENKNNLLASVNAEWLVETCNDNSIGLYEMEISEFVKNQKMKLKNK